MQLKRPNTSAQKWTVEKYWRTNATFVLAEKDNMFVVDQILRIRTRYLYVMKRQWCEQGTWQRNPRSLDKWSDIIVTLLAMLYTWLVQIAIFKVILYLLIRRYICTSWKRQYVCCRPDFKDSNHNCYFQ
jgi:hypothetical protein